MSLENAEQVAQPEEMPMMETPSEVAQGGSGNEFLNMIPEELRDHPSISPIKDVENLARSYVNAQKLIGADKIPLPVNPTDEDLDRIYDRLGRPASPTEYGIHADGNIITEDLVAEYSDIAHKLRLTPEQAKGVLDYYKSSVEQTDSAALEMVEEARESTVSTLRQEWGRAFDQKVEAAATVAQEFASPDMFNLELSDGSKLGDNVEFIKAFAKIADFRQSVTSEDTVSENSQSMMMTPAHAKSQVEAIMGDKTHPYWDKKNPGHASAVEHMQGLMGMLHG
ncbi:hypothetical protein N9B14_01495 [Akkermansiaceae bacterium]|nr:hypothetical protein [Akkermansiaceae bacterium]